MRPHDKIGHCIEVVSRAGLTEYFFIPTVLPAICNELHSLTPLLRK